MTTSIFTGDIAAGWRRRKRAAQHTIALANAQWVVLRADDCRDRRGVGDDQADGAEVSPFSNEES